MQRLGIIGGGAMGSAIIHGLIAKQTLEPSQIIVVETDQAKIDYFKQQAGVGVSPDSIQLAKDCDTIILAVKPHIQPVVAADLAPVVGPDHLLISIAAGVSLATLESWYTRSRVIRTMPNTPLQVGRGVTVFCPGKAATADDAQLLTGLFGVLGKTIQLPEHLFDAATAVSGSGPAYVYYLVEAMIDAGVMLGLSRSDATVMVTETFGGSVAMLQQTGAHPAKLRNDVTSPGGTTAAALYELEKAAVTGSIMRALQAAAQRSQELGKK